MSTSPRTLAALTLFVLYSLLTGNSAFAADTIKRVVLINGADSELGQALAARLLSRNYKVYGINTGGTATSKDDKSYLTRMGGVMVGNPVTTDLVAKTTVSSIIRESQRLDALIHIPNLRHYGPVEELPEEAVSEQFDSVVMSYARLLRASLPFFRDQGYGRIVQVSSIAGISSSAGIGWYAAAERANEALSDTLALELAPFGVQVVKVRPGRLESSADTLARQQLRKLGIDDDYAPLVKAMTTPPEEPAASPNSTADALVFALETDAPKMVYNTTEDAQKAAAELRSLSEDALMQRRLSQTK